MMFSCCGRVAITSSDCYTPSCSCCKKPMAIVEKRKPNVIVDNRRSDDE